MKVSVFKSLRTFLALLSALLVGTFSSIAQVPYVNTQVAGPIRATTATLNGMVVPRGRATTAWFEWGIDRSYGNTTTPQNIGLGTHVIRVREPLAGLVEGRVYHFRLVASNSVGVARGFDFMFTTGMKIQSWGSFYFGFPPIPQGLTNLCEVACGYSHDLAIRNDGTVVAWQTGLSSTSPYSGQDNVPPGLSNVVAVAGGIDATYAVKEDGTVVGWGNTGSPPPPNLTNAIAISAGDYFAVALKADGTLVAWGDPRFPTRVSIPPGLIDVVAISCGFGHTLALKADGTVSVWGGSSLTAPASATNLVAVGAKDSWNVGLRVDGTIVNWPTNSVTESKPTDLTNVVAIAAGQQYIEVLKADGTLIGWGWAPEVTPIPAELNNVVAFVSGYFHRIGLAPVNLPPKIQARKFSCALNQELPISLWPLVVFDPNGDALSLQITSLPTKGKLYQYTDSGPGSVIDAAGTLVTDASRVVFVPETDASGIPYDSFGVMGTDQQFSSGPATVTISVVAPPVVQSVSILKGPPSSLVLKFTGGTDVSYSVWRKDSIERSYWSLADVATQIAPGQFSFTDSNINNSVRFYRIQYP